MQIWGWVGGNLIFSYKRNELTECRMGREETLGRDGKREENKHMGHAYFPFCLSFVAESTWRLCHGEMAHRFATGPAKPTEAWQDA